MSAGDGVQFRIEDRFEIDALHVTPYQRNADGTYIGGVELAEPGIGLPGHFRMVYRTAPGEGARDPRVDSLGLLIEKDLALPLMLALLKHFGHDPSAQPEALLRSQLDREAGRVDKMIDHLISLDGPTS